MIVNFEFLGNEPIENVITCMKFQIDKVVFFGYHETIQAQKECTENFLKKYCGVGRVIFQPLSHDNLQSVLKTMRKEIEQELGQKNKLYFDITGGEELILVAFGMLSKEFETPMHMYDIPKDRLIELEEGASSKISRDVKPQKVEWNLKRYIELRGGIINDMLQKEIKDSEDLDFEEDVSKVWEISKKYRDYWNPFSDFLRAHMVPDENLCVNESEDRILAAFASPNTSLRSMDTLNQIIDALWDAGVLLHVSHANGRYRFTFKNHKIKDCLWEGGSILELHTYQMRKKVSDDCLAGVHLDWDGIIHPMAGKDVLNEIDVLSITGNVPAFFSCKSGKMGAQQALHALYELETVARRFGGKYAKKVLVTTRTLGDVYLVRAKEMGIEVDVE